MLEFLKKEYKLHHYLITSMMILALPGSIQFCKSVDEQNLSSGLDRSAESSKATEGLISSKVMHYQFDP